MAGCAEQAAAGNVAAARRGAGAFRKDVRAKSRFPIQPLAAAVELAILRGLTARDEVFLLWFCGQDARGQLAGFGSIETSITPGGGENSWVLRYAAKRRRAS